MVENNFDKDIAEHKSALIETDKSELGDKRLDPREAVIREREELLKMASRYKIPGQAELEDKGRSGGPKMPWQQLLFRIQKLNPKIQAKNSSVGGKRTIALYYPKTDAEKINDSSFVTLALTEREKFFRDHKYIGGFDCDWLPQYSHLILDSSNLPVREVRGVITVLLMLVRSGALTYEQIKREFEDPANDQRGERFMQQTRKERERDA